MEEPRRSRTVASHLARQYRVWLLATLVLGALLRVAVHLDLAAHDPVFSQPPLDPQAFLDWARDIAGGNVLGDKPFFLNPLYPYFLSPLVLVFGPSPLLAIRIVQMILGLATIPLVAGATRRLLGPGHAIGAAFLVATWPPLLFYEQTIMIVTLAVFLNALALWLLARLPGSPTLRRTFVAGLPLGLAILARPNVGLFAVLLPLWLLSIGPAGGRLRFAVSRTAVLALGAALVVLPVTIRNYAVGRDLVLVTSSGGVNLYVSNNPKARSQGRMTSPELRSNPTLIETDAIVIAERETGRKLDPSEVSSYWSGRAMDEARKAPLATLGFVGQKLLAFFRGYEIPSSYHYEAQSKEAPVLRWNPLSWGLLSPFMLLGFGVVVLRRRTGLPYVLLYAAYALGLAVFFPLGHYRAPVLPGAIPLGVLGFATVAAPIVDRRFSAAVRLAPGLALCLLLAFAGPVTRAIGLPVFPGTPDDRAVFFYNRGVVYLDRKDLARAEVAFLRALDEDETSWLPHVGLAALARERGEPANERRHLLAALDRRPNDPGARAHLGRNLFEAGRKDEGRALIEAAEEDAPNDGTVLVTLAGIYGGEGRTEDALELYRRAETTGLPLEGILANESSCLRALGRPEEALEASARGIALFPESGPLRYERALGLLAAGAPADEIRAEVRRALESGVEPPPSLRPFLD